ncbi:tyrosine-protein phosphatase [Nocardioides sp. YIM 152315]|uniref:tyrosine-protein phosphatase n=1 Tax=Nocardioides sp. YIM 152315 TaxID=3031760 RepID=UPI0023DA6422|nr:tyrosine-protein phosphatase [Nocardioides sp. YIM 152315]MDF1604321.1 tyrosine-protein phosphatase [Nocardioides sp. YIM 152315]
MTDAPSELLRLASADNFRDVAGTGAGYPTAGGGRVRRGVFYRSNELQLTDAEAGELTALGITRIHDLRGRMEVEAHPDVAVPGAEWRHVEVSGIPMEMVSGLEDADAAARVMREVYDAFVRAAPARASYARLLTDLATGPTPQLFHCTAGKDRTGWAAALLLEIAGVDHETILADYLLTNDVSSATREKYLALIAEHLGPEKVAVYEPTMVVEAAYLETAYAAVAADHGSVSAYLRDGLGLSEELLGRLGERLRA